jgi:DNA-binding NarL/FixJ family response regulator
MSGDMTDASTILVAIVEDDAELRETLRQLISGTPGFVCTGAFENCEAALEAFAAHEPEVVLMDINLPGMSGIDGVRMLRERHPGINVMMLTVFDDDDSIFRSICAGAVGYLLKRTSREALLNAIREVGAGGAPMNAGIARRVIELFRKTAAPASSDSSLTKRELDILQVLVDGCSYKMVAERAHISIETVRNHIKSIYAKLHVHSKSEAVVKALRERLV